MERRKSTLAGRAGGGAYSFVACLSHMTINHAVRDGAPFLLLIETPPTFGRSLRFFHTLHKNCSLILSPSCFAVCRHHLSPINRVAIVFSILFSPPISSTSHTSISSSPPLTHPVPISTFYILLLCESCSVVLCHTGTYL